MKVGQRVPNFSAVSHTGDVCSMSDFLDEGKMLVLYFYPKDSTPGCTREACDFRDSWPKLSPYCNVLGVSKDNGVSHQKFVDKYNLPFVLISDTDGVLCDLFSVINDKSMYGKVFKGIERSTFLIRADGVLVNEWRKVKVNGHVDEVLEAIKAMYDGNG
ncbi:MULTISPECIES: peroxiredoxin [Candidatus Ichthyocystis]|uniref:peroxiredoxin n=1 Tax=Candidatus Ichthyocystis TaxID=2929841 RepID=UPI000AA2C27B|nr:MULTISPECIES: peroxiredoxin [Ichthyocystis]